MEKESHKIRTLRDFRRLSDKELKLYVYLMNTFRTVLRPRSNHTR